MENTLSRAKGTWAKALKSFVVVVVVVVVVDDDDDDDNSLDLISERTVPTDRPTDQPTLLGVVSAN
jgi:hypothetical protein